MGKLEFGMNPVRGQGGFILNPRLDEQGNGALGLGRHASMHLREGARAFALTVWCEKVARSDGEITEGSHNLCSTAVLDLMAVFVVGAVAPVVEAVFDGPMGAQGGPEREGAEFFRRAARDGENGLGLNASVRKLPAAVDAGDLREVGIGQFRRTNCASEDRSGFDAPVAFFPNVALRGKKPAPGRGGCIVRAR
jgi:hypothetical protein